MKIGALRSFQVGTFAIIEMLPVRNVSHKLGRGQPRESKRDSHPFEWIGHKRAAWFCCCTTQMVQPQKVSKVQELHKWGLKMAYPNLGLLGYTEHPKLVMMNHL